ncbi:MAG: FtsQ-type POTRA domain-containing protein [Gammaproteobacteria bacterium]|nr:FtsQ-type POTRA domain-containing protein [Gammaproteobacteria bacterium]
MTDEIVKIWKSSSFIVGIVFFLTVIFFIIWGYNALFDWAEDRNDAPIDQVVVFGQFNYIDKQELEQQIRKKLDGSFFTLDVEKLQDKIEENPWVYSVSIRKEWPKRINVFVMEQDAFAVWNNDLLLNKFGDVFYANGVDVDQELPRLYGPEGNEKDVLQGYLDMQYLLNIHNFSISELVLSERYAWQLWLQRGVQLNLGRSDKITRLQRFIDLYPLLTNDKKEKLAKVDLRYDIGLAASWQQ